jgi:predicted  nucleic acid-binding Zn-ribbon protein
MLSNINASMNDTPVRKIQGRVSLYNGDTLLETKLPNQLQEVAVSRIGEKGKFFGYGICQQATVKIIDNTETAKGQHFTLSFSANDTRVFTRVGPTFHVQNVIRDENSSITTVTAYDALDSAVSHVFGELGMQAPYTLEDVVFTITSFLGLSGYTIDSGFNVSYEKGANISNNTTLRAVLNAIAEATQTIYYVNCKDYLVFKRLDKSGDALLTIGKKDYFELTTALPVTLSKIVSVTELGDNLFAGDATGVTQYVRDNPFWDNRTDLDVLLSDSINRITGLTIVPFTLKWRGNFLTEIGDKIKIETKDGSFIDTFILEDSFVYNGGFSQSTDWEYNPDTDRTTAANPATIGEKINQTFARVDKIEKNITLYVSDVVNSVVEDLVGEGLDEKIDEATSGLVTDVENIKASQVIAERNIAQLQLTTSGITQRVESTENSITQLEGDIVTVESNANKYTDLQITGVINQLNTKVAELNVTTDGITQRVASTEETISDLTLDIDAAEKEAKEYTDAQINVVTNQLNTKVAELNVTTDGITQRVENTENKLVTVESEIDANTTAIETNASAIGSLQVSANQISASVSTVESKVTTIESKVEDNNDAVNTRIDSMAKDVSLKLDKQGVEIAVESILTEGVEKVVTASKKYTFDDSGLNVSSSDSEISTVVTEDGMRIYRHSTEVLTVDNTGVQAADLHARTFLIIGENSRLEDRGSRTACFWIGPAGG